ncbi:MAG: hypothetical protein NC218_04080 [Acetobacter sp.]|nr:hypothetical protein [Acetobacter sp.]
MDGRSKTYLIMGLCMVGAILWGLFLDAWIGTSGSCVWLMFISAAVATQVDLRKFK